MDGRGRGERSQGWDDRQRVDVAVTLAGNQDALADVHQPATDRAAVSLRLGRTLIYMHDPVTVEHLYRAWAGVADTALRVLPRQVSSLSVLPTPGMGEPGVVVNAWGKPPTTARVMRPEGQLSLVRVQMGRMAFEVRDVVAYLSSATAFRHAFEQIGVAFPTYHSPARRAQALEDAQRAFPARRTEQPRKAGEVAPETARPGAPAWSTPIRTMLTEGRTR
jgi:hypothetical protein